MRIVGDDFGGSGSEIADGLKPRIDFLRGLGHFGSLYPKRLGECGIGTKTLGIGNSGIDGRTGA